MLYVLAIFVPPLATLCAGSLSATILNLILCVVGIVHPIPLWILPVAHAFSAINVARSRKQERRIIKAVSRSRA
jgi:uncharacterized membrane protein YqaE (UPF0057 family)